MACRGSSSWSLGSQIWEGDMSQLAGHLCSHNVPIFVSWSQASTILCIIFPRWITFPPPWLSTWQRPGINCIAEKCMCPVFPAGESSNFVLLVYIYTYKLYMVLACLRPINPRLSPWNHPCKIYLNVCSAQCWWVNSYRQVGPSSLYLYGIRLAKNKNQRSPIFIGSSCSPKTMLIDVVISWCDTTSCMLMVSFHHFVVWIWFKLNYPPFFLGDLPMVKAC